VLHEDRALRARDWNAAGGNDLVKIQAVSPPAKTVLQPAEIDPVQDPPVQTYGGTTTNFVQLYLLERAFG